MGHAAKHTHHTGEREASQPDLNMTNIGELESLNVELPSIAEALDHAGIPNFHRVSPDFYRSGQPKRKGFETLKEIGIKSVISLREYHSDTRKAEGTGLKLHRIAMAAGKITSEHLIQVLCLIRMTEKPLLLHCWHGSDRTGAIVMAYRIVVEGWTIDQAEAEFLTPCYGHHNFWYKNIPVLLRTTDWDRLKFTWNNWKQE